MAIQVLIINPRLDFVVGLKQALERTAAFEVHPFTSADTALEYLRYHPHDVALIDLNLPSVSGEDLIRLLRAIQRDIAMVVSPEQDEAFLFRLGLQGSTNVPVSARDIIPLLEHAVERLRSHTPEDTETLSLTRPTGSAEPTLPPTLPESAITEKPLEFVMLVQAEDEDDGSTQSQPVNQPLTAFQRIAAEEPPMPLLEDTGTVGDLRIGVADSNLREVLSLLSTSPRPAVKSETPETPTELLPTAPQDAVTDIDPTETIPAQIILETALDESTPLNQVISAVESLLPEVQMVVEEPDFIAELDRLNVDALEYTTPTTEPSNVQRIESEPSAIETERYTAAQKAVQPEPIHDSQPIEPEPEFDTAPYAIGDTSALNAEEIRELTEDFERLAAFDLLPDDVRMPSLPVEVKTPVMEDEEIAEMALRLTQTSLELTAEATLLAREGKIVAYAGTLPREDVEALDEAVANDWDASPQEARIRFITIPGSGKDYMLYSRRTENDLTLSMIFGGTMPLRVIRRQGQRLLNALQSVPETLPTVEDEETPPTEIVETNERVVDEANSVITPPKTAIVRTAYTYLWLVHGSDIALSEPVRAAISARLSEQLNNLDWEIRRLEAQEDYVYLFADVPGDTPANELIRDLKRRASDIAHEVDSTLNGSPLWADSYFVVTPGRELEVEEIQQFINFERM